MRQNYYINDTELIEELRFHYEHKEFMPNFGLTYSFFNREGAFESFIHYVIESGKLPEKWNGEFSVKFLQEIIKTNVYSWWEWLMKKQKPSQNEETNGNWINNSN